VNRVPLGIFKKGEALERVFRCEGLLSSSLSCYFEEGFGSFGLDLLDETIGGFSKDFVVFFFYSFF